MRRFSVLFALLLLFSAVRSQTGQDNQDSLPNRKLFIAAVRLIGNTTTRDWIVHRELAFRAGDSLTVFELLNKMTISTNNLNNTSLFNTVDVKYVGTGNGNVEVYVMLAERWYIWPVPVFELAETNFNAWWENKDFSRINYGLKLNYNNFRGRNEKLDLTLQFGFTEKLSLRYTIPYINRSKTFGLSLSASYGQNHEVNYSSSANKRLFYKDVGEVQLTDMSAGFELSYRRRFFSTHTVGARFDETTVSDSILAHNDEFLYKNDTGGSQNTLKHVALTYRYALDRRDNKTYPLKGNYFGFTFVNYTGTMKPLLWNKVEFKNYSRLRERLYLSTLLQAHYYFNSFQPYYFRDGLGYTDKSTVRAYELFVIDAQQNFIGKIQLRYQVKKRTNHDLPLVPVERFRKFHFAIYAGIFADAGFAGDSYNYHENKLANDLQSGYGVSLDIAAYYDRVLRIEYSINKFGVHGLFLHFAAPI